MLATDVATSDSLTLAMAWVTAHDIELRHWPSTSPIQDDHPSLPAIYLVEPNASPPRCGVLEDWVRLPIHEPELLARADTLLARAAQEGAARIEVDDGDILRVGGAIAILSPTDAKLLRVLVADLGDLVPRARLEHANWPDEAPAPRALDNAIKALRRRLDGLPLQIHTVRGRGFLLERTGG